MATATASKVTVFVTRHDVFGATGLWERLTKSGKVVGLSYIRRTPSVSRNKAKGDVDVMNVRANYTKWLAGGTAAYDHVQAGLVLVADNNAIRKGKVKVANGEAKRVECIRSFGKDALVEVRAEGKVYVLVNCDDDRAECEACQAEASLPEPYDVATDDALL